MAAMLRDAKSAKTRRYGGPGVAGFFVLFFLLCASSLLAGDGIKVTTWNMRWFPGGNPDATAEEKQVQMLHAQAALKRIAPDIFLCEEMDSWRAVEQVTSVVPGLKPVVVSDFGPAADNAPGQNVAIATRLQVVSGWAQHWNEAADGWTQNPLPRGFAFAAIQLPDGTLLLTYCVHLKSNYKSRDSTPEENISEREVSTQLLLAHIAKMRAAYGKTYPRVAVLAGGDFNTSLDDPRFKKEQTLRAFLAAGFHWGFAGVPAFSRITIPGQPGGITPPASFDQIFTSGVETGPAHVVTVRDMSDHMPVEMNISQGR